MISSLYKINLLILLFKLFLICAHFKKSLILFKALPILLINDIINLIRIFIHQLRVKRCQLCIKLLELCYLDQ